MRLRARQPLPPPQPSWYCTIVAWLLSVWYHLKPRDQDLAELMDVTVAGTVPALGFAYALGVATGLSATGLVRALLLLVAGQTTHAISMFFIYR